LPLVIIRERSLEKSLTLTCCFILDVSEKQSFSISKRQTEGHYVFIHYLKSGQCHASTLIIFDSQINDDTQYPQILPHFDYYCSRIFMVRISCIVKGLGPGT